MHKAYDYLTAELEKDALPTVRQFLGDGIRDAGGLLWGAWLGAGSIGWYDDQVIAMVAWTASPGDARSWLAGVEGVGEVAVERMAATVRPQEPAPLPAGGVLAHRWFELYDAADFDELMQLSADAWPAFEGSYDAAVEGFFRSADDPRRVLLVTRYGSVAEWERSRGVGQATSGDLAEARQRFRRRRELTRRQVVRLAPLVASSD